MIKLKLKIILLWVLFAMVSALLLVFGIPTLIGYGLISAGKWIDKQCVHLMDKHRRIQDKVKKVFEDNGL